MKLPNWIITILIISSSLIAWGGLGRVTIGLSEQILATKTPTMTPTKTPSPTSTPRPTNTPYPTSTITPTYTSTKTPTITDTPIATIPTIKEMDCIPKDTKIEKGKVVGITDGDTITVDIKGTVYPVRYIGIDAPEIESGQAFYADQAMEENKKLVMGKTVILIKDISERDSYDRLLRYVIAGNVFVNYELVKQGAAISKRYEPDTACNAVFEEALDFAQVNALGIWLPAPTDIPEEEICACNCAIDYDCSDFSTHREAQDCFECCGGSTSFNWSRLDRDRDGVACESLT